ncbi:glycosyltransferase family 2 protein [Cyanobium sp. Lug-B]|uniref:glycosyltransferase family 2 protein n=1 Tax=Cyanobium sp. Lug-B TaxID=2823716 RepID=UPI0020CCAA07|nr:glycosyltransferase [Cyanobium sp. Lug-B]MCP9796838.1 glycosyltransferase [Cyanobium sp. Lug-B]
MHPSVSVVLGSFNRSDFLKLTLASIRNELAGLDAEIIVVDGGSTDGSLQWLMRQKDVLTIVQHNHGVWNGVPVTRRSWGYFMNLGFRTASGQYVCMLSDDCLLVPGAIRNGMRAAERSIAAGTKVGGVAFYWRNWPEQSDYQVGLTLLGRMFVNHGLYLKCAVDEVGFADEETYSFYHADGDLGLKMWEAGYVCIDSPESYVEHYSHANMQVRTSNLVRQKEDWDNYLSKWQEISGVEDVLAGQGWVTRAYDDPENTAKQFLKVKGVASGLFFGRTLSALMGVSRRLRRH